MEKKEPRTLDLLEATYKQCFAKTGYAQLGQGQLPMIWGNPDQGKLTITLYHDCVISEY